MNGEHKITSSHRERAAICYLRQSSMAQVREHTESTRSQYGLADTAAALGWPRTSIEVIDTDLGISGKWGVAREGFTELVTRVCTGDVGAIFGIEITRLARSNADVALSRSKIVNRSWWRLVATKLVRVPSWAGWRGGYGGRGAGGVRECAARPPCRAAAFSA